ncbi:VOC family protein [Paracraurococcus ruber]|uniref:Glyoxalase n=1 Tax=Paracraurococcus ruber TaxID=77675 RepID=A0ABS1CZ65_9PROT|nr:VOC family protein [Paracraurococcus ruber]MBK1659834.1 glyoxalase [Paracraurococcus ruber]TDG28990.1 VOC family protein [Paracraurococcus ruber]
MYSHVTLGTADIARAIAFYDRILAPLGLRRQESDLAKAFAGYAAAPDTTPQFWVLRPLDGGPATAGNGLTVAFEAADRPTVDAVHAAALAAGGRDEGGPGLRPHYHADYYGAYFRDPDGNKLCCVCHRLA